MDFDATPQNITLILVIALAAFAVGMLLKGRYESNLPLLYYATAAMITNFIDRPINPLALIAGVSLALLLRFEFMSKGFTKFFGFLTTISICVTVAAMLNWVLGAGRPLF